MLRFEVGMRPDLIKSTLMEDFSLSFNILYRVNGKRKIRFDNIVMHQRWMKKTTHIKNSDGKYFHMNQDRFITDKQFVEYTMNVMKSEDNVKKIVEKMVLKHYWKLISQKSQFTREQEVMKEIRSKSYSFSFVEE